MNSARISDALRRMRESSDANTLALRALMFHQGLLLSTSTLPFKVALNLHDVSTRAGEEPQPSNRVMDAFAVIAGKAELGFDPDGNAHIGFKDEADEIMFRLTYEAMA